MRFGLQTRRQFLHGGVALAGLALVAGCSDLQTPWPRLTRVTRIGYLGGGSSGPYLALLDGFRQELHALGYVEGQNIAIEYRFTDSTPERAPAFAAELVGLSPD